MVIDYSREDDNGVYYPIFFYLVGLTRADVTIELDLGADVIVLEVEIVDEEVLVVDVEPDEVVVVATNAAAAVAAA